MSEEDAIKLSSGRVVAGRIIPVYNKFRKATADQVYYAIWVEDADGKNERCLLFTDTMLKAAEELAKKNVEDIPKKSWIADMMD
jgi:hypothetical protein